MFLSHSPNSIWKNGKPLENHLSNVGNHSVNIIMEKQINVCLIEKKELEKLAYIIGIFHDFAKTNNQWQREIKMPNPKLPSHAPLSALMGMKVAEIVFPDKMLYSFIAYLVIRQHHQNLIKLNRNEDLSPLHNIYKNIDIEKVKEMYEKLLSCKGLKIDIETVYNDLGNYINNNKLQNKIGEYQKIISNLDDDDGIELFFLTNFLFSILIDTDKKDAADLNIPKEQFYNIHDEKFVDNYIHACQKENSEKFDKNIQINKIKNKFYKEVIENKNITPKNKIYLLSAPTGIGKTFTAYSIALKLKAKLDFTPKIIYSLPYTSIIEQNYLELEKILKHNLKEIYQNNSSVFLLKHHYLADFSYQSKNYNSKSYLDDQLLVESWDSLNIVTTFVQVFHSLIGYKNNFLKKFHNIVNSIIILDEIQNLEPKYRVLINKTFKILAEKFNIYFILMSATQPKIFTEKEAIQLGKQSYFSNEALNKVRCKVNDNVLSLSEFVALFEKEFKDENCLIICNTRSSAIELYNFIKKSKKFNEYQKISLTNNLIPKHRIEKIEEIQKRLHNNEKIIVISTQLIEAGVDLDFNVIYRDFAPFDSIVQSSGRCNRFGKMRKKGLCNIIKLKNEYGLYSKKIYHEVLLQATSEIIKNKFDSSDFYSMSNEFFEKINQFVRDSKKLLKGIKNLNYDSGNNIILNEISVSQFKIIIENYGRKNLFLILDRDSKIIFEKYQNLMNIEDKWEKRESFIKIKKEMRNYIITVNSNNLPENFEKISENLYSVNVEENIAIYDEMLGYNTENIRHSINLFY